MEKDKGLVYDVSWRAGSQKSTKEEKKNKKRYVTGSWKRDELHRGDVEERCGWKMRKRLREGMEEESKEPSCMIGVSGRFLCDIQVGAWSQRSTDAT